MKTKGALIMKPKHYVIPTTVGVAMDLANGMTMPASA